MIIANTSPIWYWAIVIPYMFVLIGIGLWTYNFQKKQKTRHRRARRLLDRQARQQRPRGGLRHRRRMVPHRLHHLGHGQHLHVRPRRHLGDGGAVDRAAVHHGHPRAQRAALQGDLAAADAAAALRAGPPRPGQPVQHHRLRHLVGRRDLVGVAVPRALVRRGALGDVHRVRCAGGGLHGARRVPRGHQRQPAAVRHGRRLRDHRHSS